MRANKIWRVAILGLFLAASTAPAAAAQQEPTTAKEPDPFVVLRQMCDYLKSLQQFSFHSDVTDDQVYLDGKNPVRYRYGNVREAARQASCQRRWGSGEQAVLFRRQDYHPV